MSKNTPAPTPTPFKNLFHNWFRFDGRLNRRPFMVRYAAYWLLGQVIALLFIFNMPADERALMTSPEYQPTTYAELPAAVLQAQAAVSLLFLLLLPTIVRRIKDVNLHPFSAIVAYAMSIEFYLSWRLNLELDIQINMTANIISFGFILFLMIKRGTVGTNAYGPDPLETRA